MLDDEILKLRKELDESIRNEADYEYIYELSTKLDELITKYYKNKIENVGVLPTCDPQNNK